MSSREAEVRFDYRHRVWHLVHPATPGVDANAPDCCPSEEGTPSTSSDSAPSRKDGEGVLDSVSCGSPKGQVNGEKNEGSTQPPPCQETEGEKADGTPIDTPKENPRASQDADHVCDQEHPGATSKKEERCDPDGSSSAAPQEGSVREAHDDGGGGGAREGVRSSGGGDPQDGQRQIAEPREVPASPGRAKHSPSQTMTESPQPNTAVGTATTTTKDSTCSATTAVVDSESGAVTQVTWRGQSVALAEPVVITLREASLKKLPFGGRIYHESGTDDSEALAGDSEHGLTSSDEGPPPTPSRRPPDYGKDHVIEVDQARAAVVEAFTPDILTVFMAYLVPGSRNARGVSQQSLISVSSIK
eukprot:g14208.t1